MRDRLYGVLLGLAVAGALVGVYELAGGDATLVVMLILLTTYVGVRFDRVTRDLEDLYDELRESQRECGQEIPLKGGGSKTCVRRLDHHSRWHQSKDGVQWTKEYPGGGVDGSGMGHTETAP